MDTSFTKSNAVFDIEMKPEYFDTLLNNNGEIQPTKRGKKNSMVWEDFTTKDVDDGETRAVCIICKKDFAYIKGSINSGTSHLKRHLEHHKGPSKISVQAAGPIKDTPRRCKKYTPQRGSKTASVPVAFDSERLLNVKMELYPESEFAFSDAVSTCLTDWNIQGRLFSVTLNQNQPLSEIDINSLRSLLSEKNSRILNGQLVLTNCLVRALTSVAQEALQVCQELVKKVRDCVKYVKALEVSKEYFPDLKQLHVLNTRNLSLDDQTKWNTTYEMLLAASELKEEFSHLDTLYPDYFKSPSGEDWNLVDNLCAYLKLIFDTASMMASSSVPTTNTFFVEAWKIQLELMRASTSKDNIISTITKPMLEGFDKYWKSSCFVLAIAVVMDPRFKMQFVDFSFAKIFGDEATSFINIVDEGIHQLFLDYVAGGVTGHLSNGDAHGFGLIDFEDFSMKSASQQSKSELDQYLKESLLPRSHEFDVMRWWKLNEPKYPTLSKMARDILTLPVSTVDPESVFETGVKKMDRYMCTLKPQMVEALYCAKDWLCTESIKSMDSLVKMEFQI
uniref:Zinc finger BED domain-containing protein DAYSLEEPER-like n=1 Tax=Tanacetum cinerariifolium TaxID=118510 RepID=A0A6L2MQW0_TANCI|nr:zinc finger BED domain-containing protein DAYSLEEPER-like [Tanacetum cinerariifolium]